MLVIDCDVGVWILKKVKKISISVLIIAIITISVGVFFYCLDIDDSFSSPIKKLNQNDYKNFEDMGYQLFNLYDKGYLEVGEVITTAEYDVKRTKVENVLSKYKREVSAVYLVDKDVVLFSFGAIFQGVDGIAIRRNNAELENTYESTGFDSGTLMYRQLIPNVFHFTAGL